ncbi:MAG: sigma-70 family RNA polymerase sigma factor [Holophagales bacterium]|nr:sigma-70 family RNA polymerase sigma factor [Holophagales bacterium]
MEYEAEIDETHIDGTDLDETESERRLLRAMARGDRRAFDRFVAYYTPALVRYAQGQLAGQPEAIPDIVQGTLAAAVERLGTFRGDGPLGAWLLGICRFQIGTYWRRRQVRRRFTSDEAAELDRLESQEPSPWQTLERRQRRATVHSTLDLLPPPYGDVLEWKYLEEMSVKEIAARLEVSPKAAESTLTRARSAFRRLFSAATEGWGEI